MVGLTRQSHSELSWFLPPFNPYCANDGCNFSPPGGSDQAGKDDGGAAHRVAFSLDMVTAQDFFHPNAVGQNALAKATWLGPPDW